MFWPSQSSIGVAILLINIHARVEKVGASSLEDIDDLVESLLDVHDFLESGPERWILDTPDDLFDIEPLLPTVGGWHQSEEAASRHPNSPASLVNGIRLHGPSGNAGNNINPILDSNGAHVGLSGPVRRRPDMSIGMGPVSCQEAELPWWYPDNLLPGGIPISAFGGSNTKLCAKWPDGWLGGNMGAICLYNNFGQISLDFDATSADPDLLQDQRLQVYCRLHCGCASAPRRPLGPPDLRTFNGQEDDVVGYNEVADGMEVWLCTYDGRVTRRAVTAESATGVASNDYDGIDQATCKADAASCAHAQAIVSRLKICERLKRVRRLAMRGRPKCRSGACENLRCGSGKSDGCVCSVSSLNVKTGLFQVATCAFLASRRVGRVSGRSISQAFIEMKCPCNGSYVSHGCCRSPNGLVWEPPTMNSGGVLQSLW